MLVFTGLPSANRRGDRYLPNSPASSAGGRKYGASDSGRGFGSPALTTGATNRASTKRKCFIGRAPTGTLDLVGGPAAQSPTRQRGFRPTRWRVGLTNRSIENAGR